jgi:putative spermidine/putrescine transport system substrate-binding protein
MSRRRRIALWAMVAAFAAGMSFLAAGCGGGDDEGEAGGTTTTTVNVPTAVGAGEGQVNLIAWAGYVEDGSNDPNYDWVTPFEKATGCQVNFKQANSSDEMVTLMRTGNYDGVSASGDASLRLVAAEDVDPVNVDLVPNYKDLYPALKNQPYNTVDGVHYGIPHGRGANLLAWRTDVVKPAPTSWGVVFEENSPYKGKLTAYGRPIYIADAAVYLKATRPELNITDPYELDEEQFNAAVDLLKQQRPLIGEYWVDAAKQITAFTNKDQVLGTTWQYQVNTLGLNKPPVPVKAVLPEEGSTGWSDTWMISSSAKNPNCMYKWMNHIASPKAQAGVAEWFGEAPANPKACALLDPSHCEIFHANDEAYFDKVYEWQTPIKDCGDDRGTVCKDYSEWSRAWTEIVG